MLKGLKDIKEKVEQIEKFSNENKIRVLGLADGEYARIRFLTDVPEIIEASIHELEEQTPKFKIYPKKYCTKEDTGQCQYCNQDPPNYPKKTMFFWVHVFEIMHKKQNPKLEKDENAERWQQVKAPGGGTYYKEEVGKPMVLRTKRGKDNYIRTMIINFADEYGTWCDREYKWSRSGDGINTTYSLVPRDPSKMPKELKEERESLPELSDFVIGKIFSFNQDQATNEEPASEDDPEDLFK